MNLTAITDEYQIIMKHFIDCLEVTKYIEPNSNVIDIGTGAGFPGIVIAIYFEKNVDMTLVDALNKRITFLTEVKNILNLTCGLEEVLDYSASSIAQKVNNTKDGKK